MPAKATAAIGDIVLLHTKEGDTPLLVTSVGEDVVSGQAFLNGTDRSFVENAKIGKDEGQVSLKG